MAKAKKLSSGKWRALVYDYTDNTGKRKYQSFTADTKKEAKVWAADYSLNKKCSQACKLGIHKLWHYSVSIMHAFNIPYRYITERGVWKLTETLQKP